MRNLDNRVGYHLGVAAHMVQNKFNQKLAEFDLTVAQAKVLFLLFSKEQLLQSEIQNSLFIKSSTMNGIIESLLKKQLIEKNDSQNDRRSKLITLTDKGKALEAQIWLATESLDQELTSSFSESEKEQLLQSLKAMIKIMNM